MIFVRDAGGEILNRKFIIPFTFSSWSSFLFSFFICYSTIELKVFDNLTHLSDLFGTKLSARFTDWWSLCTEFNIRAATPPWLMRYFLSKTQRNANENFDLKKTFSFSFFPSSVHLSPAQFTILHCFCTLFNQVSSLFIFSQQFDLNKLHTIWLEKSRRTNEKNAFIFCSIFCA